MFLNGYTALGAFLCVIRLALGIGLSFAAVQVYRKSKGLQPETLEQRMPLFTSTTAVLFALNVASWPMLYGLLHSYVKQWPEVMCIYGVTRVGTGAIDASRFLPALVAFLQFLKPGVVFLCGLWLVLYVVDTKTEDSPLVRPLLLLLTCVGLMSITDAVIELMYIGIPRTGDRITVGCCTGLLEALQLKSELEPEILTNERQRSGVVGGHYALNLAMILALFAQVRGVQQSVRRSQLTWLHGWPELATAGTALLVAILYLKEVAAPAILGLPFHHCAYDLMGHAPESMLAVAAFIFATFCVAWAFLLPRLAGTFCSESIWGPTTSRLRFLALAGYSFSLTYTTVAVHFV